VDCVVFYLLVFYVVVGREYWVFTFVDVGCLVWDLVVFGLFCVVMCVCLGFLGFFVGVCCVFFVWFVFVCFVGFCVVFLFGLCGWFCCGCLVVGGCCGVGVVLFLFGGFFFCLCFYCVCLGGFLLFGFLGYCVCWWLCFVWWGFFFVGLVGVLWCVCVGFVVLLCCVFWGFCVVCFVVVCFCFLCGELLVWGGLCFVLVLFLFLGVCLLLYSFNYGLV
jgi:hypothetical protein